MRNQMFQMMGGHGYGRRAFGPRGGFGVPNAVVRSTLRRARASGAVSTGPCAG